MAEVLYGQIFTWSNICIVELDKIEFFQRANLCLQSLYMAELFYRIIFKTIELSYVKIFIRKLNKNSWFSAQFNHIKILLYENLIVC